MRAVDAGHQNEGLRMRRVRAVGAGYQDLGLRMRRVRAVGAGHQNMRAGIRQIRAVGAGHQEVGFGMRRVRPVIVLPLDGRYACLYGLVSRRCARAVRSCSFSVCPAVSNEDVCLLKLGGLLCGISIFVWTVAKRFSRARSRGACHVQSDVGKGPFLGRAAQRQLPGKRGRDNMQGGCSRGRATS